MKEKFIQLFLLTYAAQGVTAKTAETMFEHFGSAITEETQIETAVKGVENLVKAFQSQEDARVTQAIAKAKAEATKQPEKKGEKKDENPEPGDGAKSDPTLTLIEKLTNTVTALSDKLEGLEKGKVVDTRKSQFLETVKDMPEAFKNPIQKNIDRLLGTFQTEEEYSTFLGEIKTDYDAYQNDLTAKGIVNLPAPGMGSKGGTASKPTDKEVEDMAKIL